MEVHVISVANVSVLNVNVDDSLHSYRCECMIMYTYVHVARNVISFFTCEL